MSDLFERLSLRLIPLSPIHIATGDELDWTSAALDARSRSILRFRPEALAGALPPAGRSKLDGLGKSALDRNLRAAEFIRRAQQFFKDNMGTVRRAAHGASVLTEALGERLDTLTGSNRPRQGSSADTVQSLSIAEAAMDARTGRPFVPGSGVKGALKTAWLSGLDTRGARQRIDFAKPRDTEYLRELLGGGFDRDPFSQVMIEDFVAGPEATTGVVVAHNVKRVQNAQRSRGQTSSLAVNVVSILPGPGAHFSGALRVRVRSTIGGPVRQKPMDLLARCHEFHADLFEAHRSAMSNHAPEWWLSGMAELLRRSGPATDVALIRLGKFCTVEAKTTPDRCIRARTSRTEQQRPDAGTFFWLAGDVRNPSGVPFGWAALVWDRDLTLDLPTAFGAYNPWRELIEATRKADWEKAKPGTPQAQSAAPESLSGKAIAALNALFERGQLTDSYLKTDLQRAQTWPGEDKASLRAWIEAHYKLVVKQSFKQKPIEDLLAKLK